MYGCTARKLPTGLWENPSHSPLMIDGKADFACPRRPIKDDPGYFSELFSAYRGYKAGFLPDEGAVASQSNRGWRTLSLMDAYIARAESEKHEADMAKKGRG